MKRYIFTVLISIICASCGGSLDPAEEKDEKKQIPKITCASHTCIG